MSLKRHVLVTRPEPGLSESLQELKKRGWLGVACPALDIIKTKPFPPLACRAILLTSGQALPALSRQKRDILIITVGEKTAQRALQAGFKNVQAAEGNAASLVYYCLEKGLTGPEIILACGQGCHGQDYGQKLRGLLSVKSVKAYEVRRKQALSHEALEALQQDQVEAILFYSGETMAAFMSLCPQAIRATHLNKIKAICYSDSIAHKAQAYGLWSSVITGSYPPTCQ